MTDNYIPDNIEHDNLYISCEYCTQNCKWAAIKPLNLKDMGRLASMARKCSNYTKED